MKKLLVMGLVVFALLFLVACGNVQDAPETQETPNLSTAQNATTPADTATPTPEPTSDPELMPEQFYNCTIVKYFQVADSLINLRVYRLPWHLITEYSALYDMIYYPVLRGDAFAIWTNIPIRNFALIEISNGQENAH